MEIGGKDWIGRVEEAALNRADTAIVDDRGEQSGSPDHILAPSERRLRMIAQRRPWPGKRARLQVSRRQPTGDRLRFVPQSARSAPSIEGGLAQQSRRWSLLPLACRQAKGANGAQDIKRVTAGKTFEEQALVADPDGQAGSAVIMRRT